MLDDAERHKPTKGVKSCRATGPEGEPCTRARGHKYNDFASNPEKLHLGRKGVFKGGVKTLAFYVSPDDGYRSEADYQTWDRFPEGRQ